MLFRDAKQMFLNLSLDFTVMTLENAHSCVFLKLREVSFFPFICISHIDISIGSTSFSLNKNVQNVCKTNPMLLDMNINAYRNGANFVEKQNGAPPASTHTFRNTNHSLIESLNNNPR